MEAPTQNELRDCKLVLANVRVYLEEVARRQLSVMQNPDHFIAVNGIQAQIEVINAAIGLVQNVQMAEQDRR